MVHACKHAAGSTLALCWQQHSWEDTTHQVCRCKPSMLRPRCWLVVCATAADLVVDVLGDLPMALLKADRHTRTRPGQGWHASSLRQDGGPNLHIRLGVTGGISQRCCFNLGSLVAPAQYMSGQRFLQPVGHLQLKQVHCSGAWWCVPCLPVPPWPWLGDPGT